MHFSLTGKGSAVEWSPGFRIALRVAGRVAIAFAGAEYWLVGFAGCYALYALALMGEVLEASLTLE